MSQADTPSRVSKLKLIVSQGTGGHVPEFQLPKQQVAFHGWMTKTANEAYHSILFLGESVMLFNLSPHRLTEHLCFNLIHSECVSSLFFSWFEPIILIFLVIVALGLCQWLSSHLVLQRHQP